MKKKKTKLYYIGRLGGDCGRGLEFVKKVKIFLSHKNIYIIGFNFDGTMNSL